MRLPFVKEKVQFNFCVTYAELIIVLVLPFGEKQTSTTTVVLKNCQVHVDVFLPLT